MEKANAEDAADARSRLFDKMFQGVLERIERDMTYCPTALKFSVECPILGDSTL